MLTNGVWNNLALIVLALMEVAYVTTSVTR